MSKLIAIAMSDIHFHDWKSINEDQDRLRITQLILREVGNVASNKEVPLFISGDLYHNPKSISNRTIWESFQTWSYLEDMGLPIYAIDGNHDQATRHSRDNPSSSYLKSLSLAFKNIHNLNYQQESIGKNIHIYGIPYSHKQVDINPYLDKWVGKLDKSKINILLLHTDLPSCVTAMGHSAEEVDGMKGVYKKLKQFTWVLCGHIHLRQKVRKNIIMLGAPYQQTWGDAGHDYGYWKIYEDKVKFVPINAPKFLLVDSAAKILPDGNFYAIASKKEDIRVETIGGEFSLKLDRVDLAKNYLKATKNSNPHQKSLLLKTIQSLEI